MSNNNKKHSIADCLVNLGIVDATFFQSTDISSLDDEFKAIKRLYFQKVLREHPDKSGGDAAQFRTTQTAFEVLRELFLHGTVKKGTFATYLVKKKQQKQPSNRRRRSDDDDNDEEEDQTAEDWDDIFAGFGSSEVPSYDYFAEAAEEEMPGYKVELAKSARSQCVKCKPKDKSKTKLAAAVPEEEALVAAVPDQAAAKKPRRKQRGTTKTTTLAVSTAAVTKTTAAPEYISKGDLRVGSLDDKSGSYGRWSHLACWRVPNKVWQGLTDPTNAETVWRDLLHMEQVLLSGLSVLLQDGNEDHQTAFVQHVMNRDHWARKQNSKKPTATKKRGAAKDDDAKKGAAAGKKDDAENGDTKRTKTNSNDADEENQPQAATSVALVTVQERFVIPRPAMNGAMNDDHLDGKRFVLTGLFPEVGGGVGLSMGKDKVKTLIESFGGVVTGSVSGKTNYLVVGKEPGASKVGEAQRRDLPMLDLRTLRQLLMGEISFDQVEAAELPKIQSFSAGYGGKMLTY